MSGQVETLQGLLARVQHNRQQPRAESRGGTRAPEPVQALTTPASLAPELIESLPPVPAAPAPAPAMREPKAAVSPPTLTMPSAPPMRETAPGHAPPAAPAPAFEAVASSRITAAQRLSLPPAAPSAGVAGAGAQGVVIAAPVPSAPSRPIAVAVSPAAPQRAATFGDLLWRSLALRPR